MGETFSQYNEQRKVEDPDVARKMAEAEDPYHKKTLGVFNPSKRKLEKGEKAGEEAVEAGEPVSEDDLPESVEHRFYAIRGQYRDALYTGQLLIRPTTIGLMRHN
jgi:hypothetical protein